MKFPVQDEREPVGRSRRLEQKALLFVQSSYSDNPAASRASSYLALGGLNFRR